MTKREDVVKWPESLQRLHAGAQDHGEAPMQDVQANAGEDAGTFSSERVLLPVGPAFVLHRVSTPPAIAKIASAKEVRNERASFDANRSRRTGSADDISRPA